MRRMEELIGEKSFGILQFCFPPKHSPALSCFRTTTAMYLSLNSKCICLTFQNIFVANLKRHLPQIVKYISLQHSPAPICFHTTNNLPSPNREKLKPYLLCLFYVFAFFPVFFHRKNTISIVCKTALRIFIYCFSKMREHLLTLREGSKKMLESRS